MNEKTKSELLFRAIDQSLNSQEFELFQELLESDSEFRDQYLHAIAISEVLEEQSERSPTAAAVELKSDTQAKWMIPARSMFGIAAAGIVIASCVIAFMLQSKPTQDQPQLAQNESQPVAKIVKRVDCVLLRDKWGVNSPSDFQAGDSISVMEGVLGIEFASGARVAIEGPSEIGLTGNNQATLRSGRLTAFVPEKANGFEIITPSTKVIDHGTEFGVSVNQQGDTETFVYQGEIELVRGDESVRIFESMGASAETKGELKAFEKGENEDQFIRFPSNAINSPQTGNVAPIDDLVAWFDAKEGVQVDAESNVVSWQSKIQGDRDAPVAWQVKKNLRPKFQSSALENGNQSCIAFEGKEKGSCLVTTPIETGDEVTIIAVCCVDTDAEYGPILSFEGRVRFIISHACLPIPKVISNYFDSSASAFHNTEIEGKQLSVGKPFVFAAQHSLETQSIKMFINNELHGSEQTLGSIGRDAPLLIGSENDMSRFFFNGKLFELLIFDRLLTTEELANMSQTLATTHKIDLQAK